MENEEEEKSIYTVNIDVNFIENVKNNEDLTSTQKGGTITSYLKQIKAKIREHYLNIVIKENFKDLEFTALSIQDIELYLFATKTNIYKIQKKYKKYLIKKQNKQSNIGRKIRNNTYEIFIKSYINTKEIKSLLIDFETSMEVFESQKKAIFDKKS